MKSKDDCEKPSKDCGCATCLSAKQDEEEECEAKVDNHNGSSWRYCGEPMPCKHHTPAPSGREGV